MEVVSIYLLIPVGILLTLAIELFIVDVVMDAKDTKRNNKDDDDSGAVQ